MATVDEIITLVQIQLSSSASIISTEGYESALDTAVAELGWSIDTTNPTRIQWLVKRTLRHSLFILWVASAQKFKYKQVNLQQRFEHYQKLIDVMDAQFDKAVSNDLGLFSNVDTYKQFGTAVGAGFVYDSIGRDMTYDVSAFLNSGE